MFRSIIYPVGDTYAQPMKAEYKLQGNARVISQETMQYILDARVQNHLRYDASNNEYHTHTVYLNITKEFAPKLGEVLLFDHTCDFMPGGYVGKLLYRVATVIIML